MCKEYDRWVAVIVYIFMFVAIVYKFEATIQNLTNHSDVLYVYVNELVLEVYPN